MDSGFQPIRQVQQPLAGALRYLDFVTLNIPSIEGVNAWQNPIALTGVQTIIEAIKLQVWRTGQDGRVVGEFYAVDDNEVCTGRIYLFVRWLGNELRVPSSEERLETYATGEYHSVEEFFLIYTGDQSGSTSVQIGGFEDGIWKAPPFTCNDDLTLYRITTTRESIKKKFGKFLGIKRGGENARGEEEFRELNEQWLGGTNIENDDNPAGSTLVCLVCRTREAGNSRPNRIERDIITPLRDRGDEPAPEITKLLRVARWLG